MTKQSLVGKSLPRLDALAKVTGQAVYAVDFTLPGMLHGAIFRSTQPHARIGRLDTSRARDLPGVRAVITARDIPPVLFGGAVRDQRVFALDEVRYMGQPVAAIAADSLEIAREALDLIEIDYDPLPAVYDPEAAMQPDAPLIHNAWQTYETRPDMLREGNVCSRSYIRKGDVESAFAQADFIFEDRFETRSQHQGYTEPRASVAKFDTDGHLTVWSNTQLPFRIQSILAETLELPAEKVRVIATYSGGGFGGKLQLGTEHYAALLAQATGRPVRVATSVLEELTDAYPRQPTIIYLKSGVMHDGAIVAREGRIILDTGAFAGSGPPVASVATLVLAGPYKIPNLRLEGCAVYTNKANFGSFRAPSGPQGCFAVESHMDIIAHKMGLDPLELRLRNVIEEGDPGPTGQVVTSVSIREVLERAAEAIKWGEPAGPNRGKGIACSWWTVTGGSSEVHVKLNPDGTVVLSSGAAEIGTGAITSGAAQILAEALSVDLADISIANVDTDEKLYDFGAQGSRTTFSVGNAARQAAGSIRSQLFELASQQLGVPLERLELAHKAVMVKDQPERRTSLAQLAQIGLEHGREIEARGSFTAPKTAFDEAKVVSHFYPTFNSPSFHAHAAEVEVDPGTGQISVHRYVAVQDVGFAINPRFVEGQIEGGVVQGLGQALSEELLIGDGQVLNPNLTDYKMPTVMDVPPIEVILVEHRSEVGPYGAKGVGEPPAIEPPATIANAVAAAVGVRIKSLPITAEKVLKALRESH